MISIAELNTLVERELNAFDAALAAAVTPNEVRKAWNKWRASGAHLHLTPAETREIGARYHARLIASMNARRSDPDPWANYTVEEIGRMTKAEKLQIQLAAKDRRKRAEAVQARRAA